ncbi:MAG: CpsB/CapC family capsule biosynthesis tyrosine phosphatase [Pseudomonadota bacterium]
MYADLHCHLLPGIDDGAKHMEQSLAMARLAVADGIRSVVVTPHHLNGVYSNRAADIHQALGHLREALLAEGIPLKLLPGAELHLVPELPDELAAGHAMTLANQKKAVLIELPVHTVPLGSDHLLEQILAMGLVPIIAHPERNTQLREHPEMLEEWVDMGCLGQITAQSCTGQFGPRIQERSREMIRRGLIHVVASDAHRDRRRIPKLSEAHALIERWTNATLARLLCVDYPQQLITGKLPNLDRLIEVLPSQRPWWRRLFA